MRTTNFGSHLRLWTIRQGQVRPNSRPVLYDRRSEAINLPPPLVTSKQLDLFYPRTATGAINNRLLYLYQHADIPPQRLKKYQARIENIIDKVQERIAEKGYPIRFNPQNIRIAASLMFLAHAEQVRKTEIDEDDGLPKDFCVHEIAACEQLVETDHVVSEKVLIAALLHDVVEDTKFKMDFIKRVFGQKAADLVDGVTKIEQLEKQAKGIDEKNIDKFVEALQKDLRVLLIKASDRAHNLLTSKGMSREYQTRNAREALDLYVPLLVLAGFMKTARHLADIAFKVLDPEKHAALTALINETQNKHQPLLDTLSKNIREDFEKAYLKNIKRGLPPKSWEAVEEKIKVPEINFSFKPRTPYEIDQIATLRGAPAKRLSDIVMMQITAETEEACRLLLGAIHRQGIPIDARWHDYIADPKINGYQSTHTGINMGGTLIRIQVRTQRMHDIAHHGPSMIRCYEHGKYIQLRSLWLKKEIIRLILSTTDPKEKIKLIKNLADSSLISVTLKKPHGNFESIPNVLVQRTSTPYDIAFLSSPKDAFYLEAADVEDVALKDLSKPLGKRIGFIRLVIGKEKQHKDWLELLSSPLAKKNFNEYLLGLTGQERDTFARNVLAQELEKNYLTIEDMPNFPDHFKKLGYGSIEGALVAIGCGEVSAKELVEKLIKQDQEYRKNTPSMRIAITLRWPKSSPVNTITDPLRHIFGYIDEIRTKRAAKGGQVLEMIVPQCSPLQTRQLKNLISYLKRGNIPLSGTLLDFLFKPTRPQLPLPFFRLSQINPEIFDEYDPDVQEEVKERLAKQDNNLALFYYSDEMEDRIAFMDERPQQTGSAEMLFSILGTTGSPPGPVFSTFQQITPALIKELEKQGLRSTKEKIFGFAKRLLKENKSVLFIHCGEENIKKVIHDLGKEIEESGRIVVFITPKDNCNEQATLGMLIRQFTTGISSFQFALPRQVLYNFFGKGDLL